MFPNSERLDTEYRNYHGQAAALETAQKLFTQQQDKLKFLEDSTKQLLLAALKNANGTSNQSIKAQGLATEGAKSIAKEGTLLSRRGFFKALGVGVVAGAGKKIGEDVVTETGVGESLGKWINDNKDIIPNLFADLPEDFKAALKLLLDSVEAIEFPDLPNDMFDV